MNLENGLVLILMDEVPHTVVQMVLSLVDVHNTDIKNTTIYDTKTSILSIGWMFFCDLIFILHITNYKSLFYLAIREVIIYDDTSIYIMLYLYMHKTSDITFEDGIYVFNYTDEYG